MWRHEHSVYLKAGSTSSVIKLVGSFSGHLQSNLLCLISDHICILLDREVRRGKTPIRCENMWLKV